jgi:hypothetical protein
MYNIFLNLIKIISIFATNLITNLKIIFMKKVISILAVATLCVALFGSCKKTCTCVTTENGTEVSRTEMNLTGAQQCADLESTATSDGVTIKMVCN